MEIIIVDHAIGAILYHIEEDVIDPNLGITAGDQEAEGGIGGAVCRLSTGDDLCPFAAPFTAVQIHHRTLHGLIVAVRLVNAGAISPIKLHIHPNGRRGRTISGAYPEGKFIGVIRTDRNKAATIDDGAFQQGVLIQMIGLFTGMVHFPVRFGENIVGTGRGQMPVDRRTGNRGCGLKVQIHILCRSAQAYIVDPGGGISTVDTEPQLQEVGAFTGSHRHGHLPPANLSLHLIMPVRGDDIRPGGNHVVAIPGQAGGLADTVCTQLTEIVGNQNVVAAACFHPIAEFISGIGLNGKLFGHQ